MSAKDDLHSCLRAARETVLWKLDGLPEYDRRRPLTPTGTNLLGLVKHLTGCEAGYFGAPFGRPFERELPWLADTEPNADMWARPTESSAEIVALYREACAHADVTIEAFDLDAPGHIPQWGGDGEVTLHRILVHMTAETQRHAGHADIVRELVDGATGLRPSHRDLPDAGEQWWSGYRERVERAAREALP
ncbi:DinB family protein [Amycolatopsis endophytica]|uniref:DinB family protein n=1 Tax=Amycolatopsis endophytica TaxID=860233 RepID=A0A853B814_9PSEU|nr:DinB family protein [Amycolatopsis endophytica]NYI90935.1 hypothetical protein [Amycolatopsis endophytica]